ncbi:TetR/AcrR family transcriptional regulator [Lonepinella sp. BR2271]|uniref:TetR/AcrR family transcriptional regulator n=1 Tax=Lonepinella sp. BR2271 TaxID=3434550 RepID=UPI003F6DECCB
MAHPKTDLRIIRSHKLIRNALIELLNQKNYHDINVQDILDLAMVNRSTFYTYYSGKDDLVGKMMDDLKAEIKQLIELRQQANDLTQFFETAMPKWYELRHVLLALWKVHTPRHHLFEDMIKMFQKSFVQLAEGKSISETDLPLQSLLFAHSFLTAIRFFFEKNQKPDAKKIMDLWQNTLDIAVERK